jgi:nucleotide-binding universal stress UspA family protein
LPFLQEAAEVIVAEICERSDEVTDSQHRLRDVAEYLKRHAVKAISERVWPLGGTDASTLIQMAKDTSADLIVAGAYGRSRVGEWVFGGVTQSLLARSPICCLLSH